MPVSARLVQLTISGGMLTPLLEVSLYPAQTVTKSSSSGLREFKDGKEEDKVPVSARLVQLTISGGMLTPLLEVSLYPAQTDTKSSSVA
ncbi:hypothetical protein [Caldifermentibacillus hisashii]|uniref:hypothetical protein n=1 Tax=Caldifermentibacillus hisashii TaxID=996558 RepID=UPI003D20DC15